MAEKSKSEEPVADSAGAKPDADKSAPAVDAAPVAVAAPAGAGGDIPDAEAQALLDAINGAPAGDSADTAGLEDLLKQANFEDPGAAPPAPPAEDAEPMELPSFQQVMQDAQVSSIDLLRDVELTVKIELGRNRMLVEDVLKLAEGSVVELDKLAGDPVDVFVNERLVARGEVLVLNDNFCVRVNEIVADAKEEGL
jgi:flagellar motor switch protein FliN/FliY